MRRRIRRSFDMPGVLFFGSTRNIDFILSDAILRNLDSAITTFGKQIAKILSDLRTSLESVGLVLGVQKLLEHPVRSNVSGARYGSTVLLCRRSSTLSR